MGSGELMTWWQWLAATGGAITALWLVLSKLWPFVRGLVAAVELIQAQLQPNAGSSLLDRINRMEQKIDDLIVEIDGLHDQISP